MSGIYIKGMEMPTEGGIIVVYKINGQFFAARAGKDELCSLIPVPDHGRLIDADALNYFPDDSGITAFDYVIRSQIIGAHTFIPADKEDV